MHSAEMRGLKAGQLRLAQTSRRIFGDIFVLALPLIPFSCPSLMKESDTMISFACVGFRTQFAVQARAGRFLLTYNKIA